MKSFLRFSRKYRYFAAVLATSLTSVVHAAPGWTVETFTGITGAGLSEFTGSPLFYSPSASTTVSSSISPLNQGDNFGRRMRGYIIAPTSGLYTFWESGDDAVSVFLSPDDNPANRSLIAWHTGWTTPQQWTKFSSQQSRPISLVAGKKYYIEILHKEALGGDHVAIAWTPPASSRALIPLSVMETFESTPAVTPPGLTRETYIDLPGSSIAHLLSNDAFLATPTSTNIQADGLSPSSLGANFAVRLRGYITPPASGGYTFWECGDDEVQFYLSPTPNPADKQLIARHNGFTNPLEWEKNPSQKSRIITLTAGQSYYVEVIHKEASGADHCAIAWTPPSGVREIIPASVLQTWIPAANDQDGDSIPDEVETILGSNPNQRDSYHDSDGDGIPDLREYVTFSNPIILDEVFGTASDDIWFNMLGDKLNHLTYKNTALRNPDRRNFVTGTTSGDVGDNFTRRIRGYIVAPTTGDYQFWGSADDDMDFHLSTSSSKFGLQHIIRNNVFGGGFDSDPSQKSALIPLVAGQKYYFELWHKEGELGSFVALAWKAPGGIREHIPGQFLRSFTLDPDDQDDDGLSDSYELANGLSTTDDGRNSASTDGAYGDLDGDGLSNLEEQKNNTAANLVDSDGDGVSDYDEVNFFGSATLANDIGAFTPVATIAGDAYTASFGEWDNFAGQARQNCSRGSVTYPVTVPASGIHALKFTISSIIDGAKNEQHDFHLKLNGKHLAYKTITILPDGTSTLAVLTPWLQAGQTYNLELFVDNSYNWRRVSINQLQILAAGGTDSNENNIPDWTEIRVNDLNGLDTPDTIHSKTSPAVLEGKAQHLGLVTTNAPALIAAPNGRFFTEVPLAAATATELSFTFENNALQQNAAVHWLPTNLKTETSITIREGDSLLLTAFDDAENASLESYSYSVSGATMNNTSDQPTVQLFAIPGNYTITTTHTAADGNISTSVTTINVLVKVTIAAPVCIVGYPRTWTPPALPSGATLILDSDIEFSSGASANSYTIATSTPVNQALIVRSSTGKILGASEVKCASVRSSDVTGNMRAGIYNSMQIIHLPVIFYGDYSSIETRCDIIIGGVTYQDGTTSKVISSLDIDNCDAHLLRFYKPITSHSNCHKFTIFEKSEIIAVFN